MFIRLANPPPGLGDPKLERRYWLLAANWFLACALTTVLWSRTIAGGEVLLRLVGASVGLVALALMLLRGRWRLDGWTAFLLGAFGAAPALLAMLLVINLVVGRTENERLAILGIHEVNGTTVKYFELEGGRYSQLAERVLQVPHDPQAWYADTLEITVRHGILGVPVLLHRNVLTSATHRLLPER